MAQIDFLNNSGSISTPGSFYEWFYNVLLTSMHSIPIQSFWLVNIGEIPRLYTEIDDYEKWGELNQSTYDQLRNLGLNAMIFARAVTIPGDGFGASKLGLDNTGVIKGNVGSGGRKELENLKISFLETNFSFTDTILRPWVLYNNHKSLKQARKTTITITQFAKAGTDKTLIPRGTWTYINACPINIQSQEYSYEGDKVIDRDCEWVYDYYKYKTGEAIDSAVRNLVGEMIENADKVSRENKKAEDTSRRWKRLRTTKDSPVFPEPERNVRKRTIHTGINQIDNLDTPLYNYNIADIIDESGVQDKGLLEKYLDRAKSFGVDLLKGTGERVLTNIAGQASEAVERLIREGESAVRGTVDGIANGILEFTGDTIDKLTGFEANEDVITRTRSPLDALHVADPTDTSSTVTPPVDDTPLFNGAKRNGGSNFLTKTSQRGGQQVIDKDLPNGGEGKLKNATGNAGVNRKGNISDAAGTATVSKNNADTPLFFTTDGRNTSRVYGNIVDPNQMDIPNTRDLPTQYKPVNENDVVKNISSINLAKPNQNDTVTSVNAQKRAIDGNDIVRSVTTQNKSIDKNDTVTSVRTQSKPVNSDDIVVNVRQQPVSINANDTVTSVGSQNKTISENDTVISVNSQNKDIKENDYVSKNTIKYQQVNIKQNDTAVGSNIQTQIKIVKRTVE